MKSFGKHSNCPTSHEVLSYAEGRLRSLASQRIAQHCALCDFCGAEAQLLTRFRAAEEDYTPAPTPAVIRVLGVNLSLARPSEIERRRAA
jgi:anti-sigma factor ChrR (cupin superfamily)